VKPSRRRERPDTAAPDHRRLRLTVAYDGAAYVGWQLQPEGVSVQLRLEEALGKLFPSAPRVCGSSRTDTGVHARGLVAHFDAPRAAWRAPARKLVLALNAHLPDDIRVVAAARARPDFHARFDTCAKQYRYAVWNHAAHEPLLRGQAWHVPRPLDVAAMRAAAVTLVGRHDFRAFAANPGYDRASYVRTVTRCDVRRSGPLLTFVLEADGFLYKMCRGIVGTLVQVGVGKFAAAELLPMLAARDRSLAGMNAPAHGLVLWRVYYRHPLLRPRSGPPEPDAD
jgi:tRNA pseudouridine38-40 synthase